MSGTWRFAVTQERSARESKIKKAQGLIEFEKRLSIYRQNERHYDIFFTRNNYTFMFTS